MQELKLGPKQPHLNGTHPKADSQSHQQGAGPSMPLPRTDTEYGALPVVEGPLQPGALVAYKLLEIGPDWAPQVVAPCLLSVHFWVEEGGTLGGKGEEGQALRFGGAHGGGGTFWGAHEEDWGTHSLFVPNLCFLILTFLIIFSCLGNVCASCLLGAGK